MNTWYYWQESVPDLVDNRLQQPDADEFLTTREPLDFFDSLLFETDRFSYATSDYESLSLGASASKLKQDLVDKLVSRTKRSRNYEANIFIDFFCICDCSKVLGVVKYVIPQSQASQVGVTRGMLFDRVNGVSLNILLQSSSSYYNIFNGNTLTFRSVNNGDFTSSDCFIINIGQEYTVDYVESDIAHVYSDVLSRNNQNIGYIMFTGFYETNEYLLNEAFENFITNDVTSLIIDLRYNPGGLVRTANKLISMIDGALQGTIGYLFDYNSKINSQISLDSRRVVLPFFLTNGGVINSLRPFQVYFIVSSDTASASELTMFVIKNLRDATIVGEQTVGKPFASITLLDYLDDDTINPAHTYGMQPIVTEIRDANGNSGNYYNGFVPDVEESEYILELGTIGSPTERLLERTLQLIDGTGGTGRRLEEHLFKPKKINIP